MSDGNDDGIVEPVDDEGARSPVPARLAAAGEPASAAVEAVLAAVRDGRITSKLAREVLVRLIPPAKPTVRLRLPTIVDGASYAAATQRIMKASATGKIAPGDAAILLRNARATHAAVLAAARQRHRLV